MRGSGVSTKHGFGERMGNIWLVKVRISVVEMLENQSLLPQRRSD